MANGILLPVIDFAGMADQPALEALLLCFRMELKGECVPADRESLMNAEIGRREIDCAIGKIERIAVPVQNRHAFKRSNDIASGSGQ